MQYRVVYTQQYAVWAVQYSVQQRIIQEVYRMPYSSSISCRIVCQHSSIACSMSYSMVYSRMPYNSTSASYNITMQVLNGVQCVVQLFFVQSTRFNLPGSSLLRGVTGGTECQRCLRFPAGRGGWEVVLQGNVGDGDGSTLQLSSLPAFPLPLQSASLHPIF